MIKKVFFLFFAFVFMMFVSGNSDVTYSFFVGQTVDDGASSYNPPFSYYLYDVLWILFAVLFVFFLFRTKAVSDFFKKRPKKKSKKKVVKKVKKARKKVSRKK